MISFIYEIFVYFFFFFKRKTADDMRISDWISDVCSSDLNGRRTDLTAIDAKGQITIVEIKVSRADLHGDGKWPDYCDWCDRFYWALAAGLDPAILGTEGYRPETSGLIVADRYGAAVVREAASCHLAPARRKAELLRIGRLAMRRSMLAADPELAAGWSEGV